MPRSSTSGALSTSTTSETAVAIPSYARLPFVPTSTLFDYSRVGGEFPLPIITHAPSLVTSSTVRKMVAGPGGYTRPFGGATNVSDLRSAEIVASMKTKRALEWKA